MHGAKLNRLLESETRMMNQLNTDIEAELVYAIDTGEPAFYEVFNVTDIGEKNTQTDRQIVTICDGREGIKGSHWRNMDSSWSGTPVRLMISPMRTR